MSENPLGYAIWLARIARAVPAVTPQPPVAAAPKLPPLPKKVQDVQSSAHRNLSPNEKLLREAVLGVWTNVTWEHICSRYTVAAILTPRQVFAYLAREHLKRHSGKAISFPEIARIMNRRDHTPIINSCKRIKKRLETDDELRAKVAAVLDIYHARIAERDVQKKSAP